MDNNIKEILLENAKKKYADFNISDKRLTKILNILIKNYKNDDNIDIYYSYYFKFNEEIELYILNQIKKGNIEYQILFSELKQFVIKRYFALRPDKLNYFNENVSNKNDKEYNIKFNKYCENICDDIILDMMKENEVENSINKTIIKKIPMNLTKNYFNI